MDEYCGLQKDGVYRHFKGNEYIIIGFGRCSETKQIMVIYKRLDIIDAEIWVRPATMFAETVNRDGKEYARFQQTGVRTRSHFI